MKTYDPTRGASETGLDKEALARLVGKHEQFVQFLRARVPGRQDAEEILQQAYVKAIERGGSLRDSESVTAWFYQLLRNAVVDFYRKNGRRERALQQAGDQWDRLFEAEDPTLEKAACQCVTSLLDTLSPSYATVLRRVDVDGEAVVEVARELGISSSNAGVRLHRARKSLFQQLVACCGACAKEEGCSQCACDSPRSDRDEKTGGIATSSSE